MTDLQIILLLTLALSAIGFASPRVLFAGVAIASLLGIIQTLVK